jgi:hypothetical protein
MPQPTFAAAQASDRLEWKPNFDRPARIDAVARFWPLRGTIEPQRLEHYRERISEAILPSPLSLERIRMSATIEGSDLPPVTF